MRVARLHAEKVHGYLPINVEFFDDLTFLTGLNGSGKTSALRLLMALLTPNLDELGSISFATAAVAIQEDNREVTIEAEKSADGVTLSITSMPGKLQISSSELELYVDARHRSEARSPIIEKYQKNPIFQRIKAVSTPMFLGLDRRFYAPGTGVDDINEMRRRDFIVRKHWQESTTSRGTTATALAEVNYLVATKMQQVRAAQEMLDERLRLQFFTKAFEYKPSDTMVASAGFPSRNELNLYRAQLVKIERAAEDARIPVPEIQSALTLFFERMSYVVDSLEKHVQGMGASRKSRKKSTEEFLSGSIHLQKDYIDWIINKPQADRILEHLSLLDKYIEDRNDLREPIARFLLLVNKFLKQTDKVVSVASSGKLTVSLSGDDHPRTIVALSSGERQLLVMLAHLSLNSNLAGSGVFIVDEPELSLHIDWQEKFVDAIREANPNVQMILATHSPAIILDRVESCRSLRGSVNA